MLMAIWQFKYPLSDLSNQCFFECTGCLRWVDCCGRLFLANSLLSYLCEGGLTGCLLVDVRDEKTGDKKFIVD